MLDCLQLILMHGYTLNSYCSCSCSVGIEGQYVFMMSIIYYKLYGMKISQFSRVYMQTGMINTSVI